MSRTVLVLNGHPDPAHRGLCQALADAYAEGARAAGHTVRRLDIATVAVYSDADCNARHVREADHAVHVGAAPARASYLDANAILLDAGEVRRGLQASGRYALDTSYLMFMPPRLAFLAFVDRLLAWLPLGAQYAVQARKPV